MTPPAALLDQEFEHPSRPFKKQKLDADSDHTTNPEESATIWSHPLGIRPSGNAFTATANLKAAIGTFALLPDELLAQFLDYLDAQDLLRLGGTCRALHAFTRSEELWKALFIEYVFKIYPLTHTYLISCKIATRKLQLAWHMAVNCFVTTALSGA